MRRSTISTRLVRNGDRDRGPLTAAIRVTDLVDDDVDDVLHIPPVLDVVGAHGVIGGIARRNDDLERGFVDWMLAWSIVIEDVYLVDSGVCDRDRVIVCVGTTPRRCTGCGRR